MEQLVKFDLVVKIEESVPVFINEEGNLESINLDVKISDNDSEISLPKNIAKICNLADGDMSTVSVINGQIAVIEKKV